jgi:hypothetical protein
MGILLVQQGSDFALLPSFFATEYSMNDHSDCQSPSAEQALVPNSPNEALTLPQALDDKSRRALVRMFRDPRILDAYERADLIIRLREAVVVSPRVPEVRVLLGMALCVDLQAQEALEELRTATEQAPDCFIARLKFGELLMRLRICDQAAEQTHLAARLACNVLQSELARKQAATIRTMQREGIERGGYRNLLPRFIRKRANPRRAIASPVLAASE